MDELKYAWGLSIKQCVNELELNNAWEGGGSIKNFKKNVIVKILQKGSQTNKKGMENKVSLKIYKKIEKKGGLFMCTI